jgi:sugar lactone lactonase YvrE
MRVSRYSIAVITTILALSVCGTLVGCGGGTGTPTFQAPRNLTGTFDGTKVILAWETSENNEETGYQIWRKDKLAGIDFVKVGDTGKGELTYDDTQIMNGAKYSYKVATDYDGEQGLFSNEVEVDTSGGGGTKTYIWVADKDAQKIYRVDAENGKSDRTFATPGNKPAGLAWDGSKLWLADFGKVKIYKLNPNTGAVESSFNAPDAGPWGLTWDGSNLWVSDFEKLKIYKVNNTGGVVTSFNAPGDKPRGLAWAGGNLWCADNGTDKIYKLNPNDGSVVSSFDTPGPGTTGLTSDGTNIWNADKTDKKIYKLTMSGANVSSFNAPGTFPMGLAVYEEEQ